jgi:hypothetical protein
MEGPEQLAGTHVETTDIFGRRLTNQTSITSPSRRAGYGDDIADDDWSPRPTELLGEWAVPMQVDASLVGETEAGNTSAGRWFERIEILTAHEQ